MSAKVGVNPITGSDLREDKEVCAKCAQNLLGWEFVSWLRDDPELPPARLRRADDRGSA